MQTIPLVSIVVLIAAIEFMVLGGMVGRARAKYGVAAPAISGHPIFERHFRVHYNTLEQLIVFVPAIVLFGIHVSDLWGAILGAVFVIARIPYAIGYVSDPKKREIGSILGFSALIPLVLGALYGAIRAVVG
jgi:glutathione S-transferase